MLGLYHYGFENLEDMARAIKRGIEEVEANLDYFSIERAKERLKQALKPSLPIYENFKGWEEGKLGNHEQLWWIL